MCRINIPQLFFATVTAALTASCSEGVLFPTEFKLERVLHQTGKTHSAGPGGINNSFTVYELPQEASAKIASGGLSYLNSLPSVVEQKKKFNPPRVETVTYSKVKCIVPGCPDETDPKNTVTETFTGPYSAPFVTWNATPVPREEKWLRHGRDLGKDWKPEITTFYQGFKGDTTKAEFIATISPEFRDQFQEAISAPGNFYSYGFYRDKSLLVVSPKMRMAFYLFRD
jgi:hypothetical protein